jgi:hypothetical protein
LYVSLHFPFHTPPKRRFVFWLMVKRPVIARA